MKTKEERANIMLDALELYESADRNTKIEAIVRMLDQQHEITRHACADNVDKISVFEGYKISKSAALDKIINTKSL